MSDHIVPLRIYYVVFAALLVLTGVTILVAGFDLGFLNTVVALLIAIGKTLLIMLYFMHLRYSSRLTWIFAGAGFVFLAILVVLTMSDIISRPWQFQPDPMVKVQGSETPGHLQNPFGGVTPSQFRFSALTSVIVVS